MNATQILNGLSPESFSSPDALFQMDRLITEFEKLGFKLAVGTSSQQRSLGKPTASLRRLNSKSLNAKPLFNHYFGNDEHRVKFIESYLDGAKKDAAEKKNRQDAKKAAKANMINPFKVGEIYYDSWGYEQTNIDFYQIVEVKPKSVVIRRIAGERTYTEHMSGTVTPLKDQFIGEEEVKPLQVMLRSNGSAEYYMKSRHGWISRYEKEDRGISFSSYA